MVNKMLSKKKILTIIALLGLISLISTYACSPIYLVNPFFVLSFVDPTASNELLRMHYALSSHIVRTPVASDAKGRLYIVKKEDSKTKILVINPQGRIERIITPRLKDGRFLTQCFHISVSPSGEYIWTIEGYDGASWNAYHRVSVHDRNGRAKTDWLINGNAINHWRIYAYAEDSAYVVRGNGGLICLRFVIGEKDPQRYKMPISLYLSLSLSYLFS